MLERIVGKKNMTQAYNQVVRNKGGAGIDGMTVSDLKPYLAMEWENIKSTILNENYRPSAVKGVEIDKPKGGKRLLGIPFYSSSGLWTIRRALKKAILVRFGWL